jgi:hypothetical protein
MAASPQAATNRAEATATSIPARLTLSLAALRVGAGQYEIRRFDAPLSMQCRLGSFLATASRFDALLPQRARYTTRAVIEQT